MPKIRITRGEQLKEEKNPRAWLTHPDNPEQVEMTIERLFPRGTTQTKLPKQHGSFKDLQAGVYGVMSRLFTIPQEGTVLYQRYLLTKGYAAELELQGFREQSEVYQKIKNSLEQMASSNTNPFE